jgi:chromosome segregation ATPase
MANELENANTNQNDTETTEQQTPADTKALEAKIKALEAENGKLRQANTNASADASSWKKKYQETLSEENRKKEEQNEQTAAMQKELENLRAERNIAKYTGTLVAPDIGMDSDTAKNVAEALNAGELEKVFDGIRKFITSHDKALRENALRNNQTLPGGSVDKTVTKAEFDKMGYTEMLKLKTEHPELYEEYTKK